MGEKNPEIGNHERIGELPPKKQVSDDTKRALGKTAIDGASKDKR
jgi:hypothetical protein